jgi:uncharacterized repeat protein (TIGR01451 family)
VGRDHQRRRHYITGGTPVTITQGAIARNWARQYSGAAAPVGAQGGGIDSAGELYLSGCALRDNLIQPGGSGKVGRGAGIYIAGGTVAITGCLMSRNEITATSCPGYGGGVYVGAGRVDLVNTSIVDNRLTPASGSNYGGGIYVAGGTVSLVNDTIIGNQVDNDGGGVYVTQGTAILSGTHVLSNLAGDGGGLYLDRTGAITATDGCVVNNSDTSVRSSDSFLGATDNWWGAPDGPSGAGSGSGDSVSVKVDFSNYKTWAPPGCPTLRTDLIIHKTATPPVATAGQVITYTLVYSNVGLETAYGVRITDVIPISVTGLSYTSSGAIITPTAGITYTWTVQDLAFGEGGVITITGVLTTGLPGGYAITNTAAITASADCDPTNNSDTAVVTIVNVPPAAADDGYTTSEDTPLAVTAPGVLGNDTDANGDPLTAVLDSGPGNGALALNPDGSFAYTPTLNLDGVITFTYHAHDGMADSNVAAVAITVTAVNDAPVAASDNYTIGEDIPLEVAAPGVLGNDTDADGDPLAVVLDSGPISGTLTLNLDGSFAYTPTLNFNGVITFTYHAHDGTVNSNTAAVAITVTASNDAPVAMDDSYATDEDDPLAVAAPGVLGNDDDIDGDTLAAVLGSGPASGTLTFNPDGSFIYTPTLSFDGVDTFTYHANDGTADSNVATVTILVNERPVTYVYLPLILKSRIVTPDLVVESITVTSDDAEVIIKNQGDGPVNDEFWVDVYVDPDPIPTAVNEIWHDGRSDQGLAWAVTASALPLAPGDVLTLTVSDTYYSSEHSRVSWPLPADASIYAQVDSYNAATTYGAVLEEHELTGGEYNNVSGPVHPLGFTQNPPNFHWIATDSYSILW